MLKHICLTLIGAAALILPVSAGAVPISGTGAPSSNAALSGGDVIGFDTGFGDFNTQTFGNVTITGTNAPITIGADFNGLFNTSGGGSLFNGFDVDPDGFRFDFGTTVSAFGFNFGASDVTWTLSAFDTGGGLIESLAIAPVLGSNNGEFFGIAAAGISFATVTGIDDFVFIDNFTSVSEGGSGNENLPEPGALALLGLGLVGFYAARRRKPAA